LPQKRDSENNNGIGVHKKHNCSYFFEKMNMLAQNITEYITDACYDLTTKQKLAKSKPSKRLGCKAVGAKVFKLRQPDS
jgi:hypothetical protein